MVNSEISNKKLFFKKLTDAVQAAKIVALMTFYTGLKGGGVPLINLYPFSFSIVNVTLNGS